MSHLDPDQLALLALGEPVASPDELSHLASCERCAQELSEMSHAAQIARSTIGDDALESPPAHVWTGIVTELGLAAAPPSPTNEDDWSGRRDEETKDAASRLAAEAPARRPSRRGIRALWVLAASLVVVAGIGLGIWAAATQLAPVLIAQATLDAFPDHPDAVGAAEVEQARDGSRSLVVTLDTTTDADAYREVWLIRSDAGALISLGVLTGDRGSFPIPDGLDLSEYSLVDVSAEPLDGDPAHSGDSIVRGQLTFA